MRALAVVVAVSIACLASAAPAAAQEGHPVKGSWIGKWEKNTVHGADVIVVLNWDGDKITGMINPGTDNIVVKNASLNPGYVGRPSRGRRQGQSGRAHHLRHRGQD